MKNSVQKIVVSLLIAFLVGTAFMIVPTKTSTIKGYKKEIDITRLRSTEVSGEISANTTWTQADSPYIVTGNILVNGGATLTIEPGAAVKFNGSHGLCVDGYLVCNGTAENPITFTSNQGAPSSEDWEEINVRNTALYYYFDHVIVEYATKGIRTTGRDFDLTVTNSTIRYNKYGIYTYELYDGHLTVENNEIMNNSYAGIHAQYCYNVAITHNNITGNSGSKGGIYLYYYTKSGEISNNTISKNSYGIYLSYNLMFCVS